MRQMQLDLVFLTWLYIYTVNVVIYCTIYNGCLFVFMLVLLIYKCTSHK